MKYCTCGRFINDDCYECPECGQGDTEGDFENLGDQDYVVADRYAKYAVVCLDEQDIVKATVRLLTMGVKADDIIVYYPDEIDDDFNFGKLMTWRDLR